MSVVGDFPLQYSPSIDGDLVLRARELRPLIEASAPEAEQERRLPGISVEALAEAGLFRLTVPRRYGGHEASFATFLAVSAELARACGSTAWVATVINICNWSVGTAPDQVREDVFGADPGARVCGALSPSGTAVPVAGGYIVTGSWNFASGSLHATWALVAVQVSDSGGQVTGLANAVIPIGEVTIKDTWHVAGMRGTGSNTLIARDVFVPAHRCLPLTAEASGYRQEPVYRTAIVPALALVLAGPQIGLARAALDYILATIGEHGISYTFYDQAIRAPHIQLKVARAAELIDTAALHVFRAAGSLDQAALADRALDVTERLRIRMDTGHAVIAARQAIDLLLDVGGASSFADSNPLQRIWRDSSVGARHALTSPDISTEAYGRALLGVDEQMTPLI